MCEVGKNLEVTGVELVSIACDSYNRELVDSFSRISLRFQRPLFYWRLVYSSLLATFLKKEWIHCFSRLWNERLYQTADLSFCQPKMKAGKYTGGVLALSDQMVAFRVVE